MRLFIGTVLTLAAVLICVAAKWPRSNAAADSLGRQVLLRPTIEAPLAGLKPLAQIETRSHDFGVVDPNRGYSHKFQVRNVGQAPLTLFNETSSAQNVSIDIDPHTLDPGLTGEITLAWQAEANDAEFQHRAIISTNDPALPAFELDVRGKTLVLLAAEPPLLKAPRIKPGQSARLETDIASPYWHSFALDVEPSIAGITYSLEPLTAEALKRLKVRSGYHLVVNLPADLPGGDIHEKLKITARPNQVESANPTNPREAALLEPVVRELPIEGAVQRRLVVFGEDIDAFGTISAGTVRPQQGYTGLFTVRVTDDEPELRVANVEANPSQIEAHIERNPNAAPGVHRLRVHIPPSDVGMAFVGKDRGKLTIFFDHPRIKKLELGVDFVVLVDRPGANGPKGAQRNPEFGKQTVASDVVTRAAAANNSAR